MGEHSNDMSPPNTKKLEKNIGDVPVSSTWFSFVCAGWMRCSRGGHSISLYNNCIKTKVGGRLSYSIPLMVKLTKLKDIISKNMVKE
ncbi:unnamed protein product [Musa acuminata subsp. malaccensis]|uniref:(wild Malaysian banana) hypothetical protein n=1 Tax=Musa acuminata subsp. malaccensis TaxID=214687 RepID=A0A8D7AI58_MUSAM|nr:unnamed protein product [Musa acuminata subsp. malaccensis]